MSSSAAASLTSLTTLTTSYEETKLPADRPAIVSTTIQFKQDFSYLLAGKGWEIENFVSPDNPGDSSGAFGIVATGKKEIRHDGSRNQEETQHNCVLKFVRQFIVTRDGQAAICGVATHADFHRELEIMTYVRDKIQSHSQLIPARSLLKIYDGWVFRRWGYADAYVEGVYVVEKLNGGDLQQFIDFTRKAHGYLAEEYLRLILLPVFQAIKVLHDHRIVHNDLKIENLVFRDKEHRQLVIVDFGLAYQFRWPNETQIAKPQFTCTPEGTPENFSPEQRDPWNQNAGMNISPANDIYAMGYTLSKILELCGHACCQNDKKATFRSSHATQLIEGMMRTNVRERLTIDDVLHSSWFRCSRKDLRCSNCGARLSAGKQSAEIFALETHQLEPKIKELRQALNKKKKDILENFAGELKGKMWVGAKLGSIVVTEFKDILGKCSGLAIFDSDTLDGLLDLNGDGAIDYREICVFLRTLGLFTTTQILSWFLLNLLDGNADGQVSQELLYLALNDMIAGFVYDITTPMSGHQNGSDSESSLTPQTPSALLTPRTPVTPHPRRLSRSQSSISSHASFSYTFDEPKVLESMSRAMTNDGKLGRRAFMNFLENEISAATGDYDDTGYLQVFEMLRERVATPMPHQIGITTSASSAIPARETAAGATTERSGHTSASFTLDSHDSRLSFSSTGPSYDEEEAPFLMRQPTRPN